MRKKKGAITLEACISVLAFLILMLLLSSLFVMFMAQNATAHALLETSESLSLDVYAIERTTVEDGHIGSVGDYLGQFAIKMFGSSDKSPNFVTDTRWYASADSGSGSSGGGDTTGSSGGGIRGGGDATGSSGIGGSEVGPVVKERFIGYLAGGDEAKADEMLKSMNVVDGIDGIDFSGSMVEDNVLHAKISYTLEYDFNIWDVGKVPVEQSTYSRLWK